MLSKPEPCEGATHNGDKLPALFIFLLNFFAKYVIAQFINEAGVNPEIADPIGVVAVQVFSRADFLWRGQSLIDIMMAKMRVVCPVVFGVRGNEGTEEGRARLGWIRDDSGSYVSEEIHGGRMTGLAAGYAAICLRDFSKSRLKNPWHPTHYWQTMASIVATPPSQRSITQYLVLRSLIDGYEGTFMKFYGNAARAALKIALVKFPEGAGAANSTVPPSSAAVGGVQVLADKLAKDRGIELRA
jgi:nucleoporin GLE1